MQTRRPPRPPALSLILTLPAPPAPPTRSLRRLVVYLVTFSFLLAFALPMAVTAAPDPPPFRLGAIPDNEQTLRGIPAHQRGRATAPDGTTVTAEAIPAQVDLSPGLPPVRSQGSQGSCVAWSIGYYYQAYQERQEHGWSLTDTTHQYSPAFIYNQINGGRDNGSSPSSAMNLLQTKGVATWASWPYSAADYTTQPTANQLQNAKPFAITNWAYFTPGDVAGMKAHLATGDPVSLSIPVYPNFDYPTLPCTNPIGPPAASTSSRGNHLITLVGYDESKQAFKMVNSWGTGWGCSGFAWLSYSFVAGYTGYGYSMTGKADTLGVVTGRVTDSATGTGVSGAQVAAGGFTIATDAAGNYALAVAAGTQTVSVSASGYATWSQSAQVGAGETSTVGAGLTANGGTTATLRGRVTSAASGAAIAGAQVGAAGVSTTTAADGSYSLTGLAPGSATLTVAATGYTGASKAVSLTAGATTTTDVALQPLPGSVSGTVTAANSGSSISGATVTMAGQTATTDAAGRYTLANVAPGTYTQQVSATGYQSASSSVVVGPGASVTKNVTLTALPGTLRVMVTDAVTGAPIKGATVTVGGLSGKTDASGVYTASLPAGNYTLSVRAPRYQTASQPVTVAAGQTTSVGVRLVK